MAEPDVAVPALNLRLVLGRELTFAEGDYNFTTLRDFCNFLSRLFETSLNSDGTVKDGAVSTTAKLVDRIVTGAKLSFDYVFYVEDSGSTTDKYQGTLLPYPTAYPSAGASVLVIMHTTRANQGVATFRLAASSTTWLDEKEIKKRGNLSLAADDIQAGELVLLIWEPLSATWRLIGGIGTGTGGSSSTQNFTGLSQYTPTDTVLQAVANTAYTFNHGLNQTPSRLKATLICTVDETGIVGYSSGHELPLDDVYDSAGDNAFTEDLSASQIAIIQRPAALYVYHKTSGALTPITMTSWRLKIVAEKTTTVSAIQAAEVAFNVGRPAMAAMDGSDVWFWSLNRDETACKLFKLDTSNGRITRQTLTALDRTPNLIYSGQLTTFKRTNGDKWLLGAGGGGVATGWFGINISSSLTEKAFTTTAQWYELPVLLDPGGSGGETDPDIYGVAVRPQAANVLNALKMRKSVYAAGYGAVQDHATIDLSNGSIVNGSDLAEFFANNADPEVAQWSTVNCYHLQWNPVARRIYLVDDWHYFLHVFTLAGTDELQDWWATPDYTELTYNFSVPLRGPSFMSGSDLRYLPQYHVAFDLDTGTEEYLVTCDRGVTGYGQITVAPWAG